VCRDRNFTPRKLEARMQQIDESIERYMSALDTADRTEPVGLEAKTTRLQDKLVKLRQQMRELRSIKTKLLKQPDEQLSLTDPDARSMAVSGRGTGIVGYNVQVVADAKHHLIVAHDVVNVGNDRAQLCAFRHDWRGCRDRTTREPGDARVAHHHVQRHCRGYGTGEVLRLRRVPHQARRACRSDAVAGFGLHAALMGRVGVNSRRGRRYCSVWRGREIVNTQPTPGESLHPLLRPCRQLRR
jgi:hypothetical protein